MKNWVFGPEEKKLLKEHGKLIEAKSRTIRRDFIGDIYKSIISLCFILAEIAHCLNL